MPRSNMTTVSEHDVCWTLAGFGPVKFVTCLGAHRQMRDWKGDPPNLYDISGSAHFINKCDNGIVVHRNNDPAKGPASEVESADSFSTLFAEA